LKDVPVKKKIIKTLFESLKRNIQPTGKSGVDRIEKNHQKCSEKI